MQIFPMDRRFSELHLVSRDKVVREGEEPLCDQSIIDLYDMSVFDESELWKVPLVFNHQRHLYFCK